MFINPYKNRNKLYLSLELIVTLGAIVFAVVSVTGSNSIQFSWFFLLITLIFFFRLLDLKNRNNAINFATFLILSIIFSL